VDHAKLDAIKENDARATGSACRHAGRAIEDCYALNPMAGRSSVYAGWKEMNDYMRENKIDEVKPEIAASVPPPPQAPPAPPVPEVTEEGSASESEEANSSASASASAKASASASASAKSSKIKQAAV